MTISDLVSTINFDTRDFSLLLVTPKEGLLEWMKPFWVQKGYGTYRNYVPEENTVLVIPSTDRFAESGSFQQFLDEIKPKLLYGELVRFHATPQEFGHPLTKDTFDVFFEISVRDAAAIHFISDYKKLNF